MRIGFATAQEFVTEGAYGLLTIRREKELDEAVKTIGSDATGVVADASKPSNRVRRFQLYITDGELFVDGGLAQI
jgi:hypothetical protein